MALKKIKTLELVEEPNDKDDIIIENESSDTKRTNVGSILRQAITRVRNETFTDLSTKAKQLIEAINELNGRIGGIETLETESKNSVVVAVNELAGKVQDSGWIALPLATGVTAMDGAAQYRKIGKLVEVRAVLSSTAELGGSYTEVTLATLPAGYIPPLMIAELQHASNHHIYQVRINTTGAITASRARSTYSSGGFMNIPVGGRIYIHMTFMVD